MKGLLKCLGAVDWAIEKGAAAALVLALSLVVGLSLAEIVLRWFDISFLWWGPLVRHLVFASAFLGGILATGRKNHISIDLATRFLQESGRTVLLRWVERGIFAVSFLVLMILAKYSWDFVLQEARYGSEAFLGIHSRFLVAIIPAGACLIGYRFFYLFAASWKEGQ